MKMSYNKLSDLIKLIKDTKNLDEQGFPIFKVGDLFEIKRGRVISEEYIEKNPGQFPVYSSATKNNGEIGKINTYDLDGEFLTWTTDGVNAGTVFYRNGKFSITNVCGLLLVNKNYQKQINLKFFKSFLNIIAKKYVNTSTSNSKLMSNTMASIPIILPPIEIQNKIVEILDSLEESWKNQVKLTNLYKKKYNFYQNKLIKLLKEDINEN